MVDLSDKKVIFIAPKFFGYDSLIEDRLKARGAIVSRMVDRPFSSSILSALTVKFTKIISELLNKFYINQIKDIGYKVDYILIINGQTISQNVLKYLKLSNPNAKLILYMWDSLENRPNTLQSFNLYDPVFSFDKRSATKHHLKFRPLFYGKSNFSGEANSDEESFVLSFIGTAHSDRYKIIKSLQKSSNNINCFWYLYLKARWVYFAYMLINKNFASARMGDFMYTPMPMSKMKNIFNRSEIIVDIEHANQTGLTIRTFDIMNAQKKMVTTNKDVINYDFYKFGNIFILDRNNPNISEDFINRRFNPYTQEVLDYYSIDGWLEEVMN